LPGRDRDRALPAAGRVHPAGERAGWLGQVRRAGSRRDRRPGARRARGPDGARARRQRDPGRGRDVAADRGDRRGAPRRLDTSSPRRRMLRRRQERNGNRWRKGNRGGYVMQSTFGRSALVLAVLAALLAAAPGVDAQKKQLVIALNQDPDILDPTLART